MLLLYNIRLLHTAENLSILQFRSPELAFCAFIFEMYRRAKLAKARQKAALQEAVTELEMPPPEEELNSPCPAQHWKRRRVSRASTVPSGPSPPQRQHSKSPIPVLRPGTTTSKSADFAGIETSTWNSFTIRICDCEREHLPCSTIVPVFMIPNYYSIARLTASLTKCSPDSGVYTDLYGNDLFNFRDNYRDYLDAGLSEITWHRNFYAGTTPGDRSAAQQFIKFCLNQNNSIAAFEAKSKATANLSSDPVMLGSDTLVTPPPHKVTLSSASPSPIPYTVRTSSTGKVTEIGNSALGSSIRPERLKNVFIEQDSDGYENECDKSEMEDESDDWVNKYDSSDIAD